MERPAQKHMRWQNPSRIELLNQFRELIDRQRPGSRRITDIGAAERAIVEMMKGDSMGMHAVFIGR